MNRLKRLVSLILVVTMTVFIIPTGALAAWDGTASSGISQGSGTNADPYIINTAGELLFFAQAVNSGSGNYGSAYVRLGADIKLNHVADYDKWGIASAESESGEGNASDISWYGYGISTDAVTPDNTFTPIGTEAHPFSGNFDGAGYLIEGLYVYTAGGYAGLFGYNSGTVANLAVIKSYIATSGNYAGGIVGYNTGVLSKVENYGKVYSDANYVGGVVGFNTGSVTSSGNFGAVNGKASVAGIAGENANNGAVFSCVNVGTVKGGNSSYGITSFSRYTSNVMNCYYLSGQSGLGISKTDAEFKGGTAFDGLEDWTFTSGEYPKLTGIHNEETHVFEASWTTDGTYHWHKCTDDECTVVSDKSTHTGGTASCSALAVCTVCGVGYGSYGAHHIVHVAYAAATHNSAGNIEYWMCDSCNSYYSDSKAQNEITLAQTVINMIPHSYSDTYSKSETEHWHECSCGAKNDVASHVYDDVCDTICNVCGYVRSVAHDYGDYVKTSTEHYKECSICHDIAERANHSYSGNMDTTCNICGYERIVESGSEDDVAWDYDNGTKTLNVEIEGEIPSYTPGTSPFGGDNIEHIEITEKVTSIGAYAFSALENLETIEILGNPSIAANAFPEGVKVRGWTNSQIDTYCSNNSIEFEGLEHFEGLACQQGVTEKNKFRFISEVGYAEALVKAGYVITAAGVDDSGNPIVKNNAIEIPITVVYKSISGTSSDGIVQCDAPEDMYLSAFSLSGLPNFTKSGYIRFTIKSYVVNPISDDRVYTNEIVLQYDGKGLSVYTPPVEPPVEDGEYGISDSIGEAQSFDFEKLIKGEYDIKNFKIKDEYGEGQVFDFNDFDDVD